MGVLALSSVGVLADGGSLGGVVLCVGILVSFGGTATSSQEGLGALLVWLVGGAMTGALLGYAGATLVAIPLQQSGAAGLGAALGGGFGTLANFLSTGETDPVDDTSVTVDMEADDQPGPRPADLFEDHPDPVLYVADEGGGPVVRAANDAYSEVFDLPTGPLSGTPVSEALLTDADITPMIESLSGGGSIDKIHEFDTATGPQPFRVRSVGAPEDGYLLFTPVSD